MASRKLIPIIVLLLFVMVSIATPSMALEAKRPLYTVGDFWEYNSTSPNITQHLRMEVVRTGVVVNGTSTAQLDSTTTTETMMGAMVSEGSVWIRDSDLAVVKMFQMSEMMGMEYEVTTYFSPPKQEMVYPLSIGKEWTITGDATIISKMTFGGMGPPVYFNSTMSVTGSVRIVSQEAVSVPAGDFDTFKMIMESDGNESSNWYSWKVGASVKYETSTDLMVLTDYNVKYPQGKPSGPNGGGGNNGGTNGELTLDSSTPSWAVLILIVVVIVSIVVIELKLGSSKTRPL